MMKKIFTAAAAAIMAAGVITGCGSSKDIGRDAALEAALADAGVSEADTTRVAISEERDDGRKTYEVRFDAGENEYEYEIQASDGSILSSETGINQNYQAQTGSAGQNDDKTADQTGAQNGDSGQTAGADTDQNSDQNGTQETQTQQNPGNTTSQDNSGKGTADVAVSMDEAVKIALDRVPGATEKDIAIELDYDDGAYKYEGDIIYERREYEFEIDANTGTILEWSEERA